MLPHTKLSSEDVADCHGSQEPLDSPLQKKCSVTSILKGHAFILLTVLGIAIGIALGITLRSYNMTAKEIKYFMFPGELLMQILQCLVLPLIASSVITAMAFAKRAVYGKIGLCCVCYYAVTSLLAVLTGIAAVVLIKPGKFSSNVTAPPHGEQEVRNTVDAFLDLIRNIFPANIVVACFRQYKTVYSANKNTQVNQSQQAILDEQMPTTVSVDGVNILGVLVICIAFGLILGSMENEAKPMLDFFDCLHKVTVRLINIAIWYSPVGIAFLVGGELLKLRDISMLGRQIGMFSITVITGLLFHSLVTLPIIYAVITQKNPFKFMAGLLQALTTAFGTSSSIMTLPITINCLENNLNMEKHLTRIMMPMATALTLDGTALYEAVAAIFIAQVHGVELNVAQIFIISLTATASATGGAGIPQGGLLTMILVLTSVGLPPESLSLIISFDWLLDRFRTAANVLADSIGVGVVQHLCRREIQPSCSTEECSPQGESDPH
ncbi:excitatory amino acid transporter 1-like isoform X1 [Takifugu rubripes]|uniref:excitatory amino acid transporter 1-like isoform X1 n=1 Tax=Takifugu rubripes TaxID=31033 RepID=UPI0011459F23|nr:excitatory amino acid transporter 1-like isoform X1 [Takifugu rubripes]